MNYYFTETTVYLKELGDCDRCVEFAKSNKNKNENPVSCHNFDTDVSFVSRVVSKHVRYLDHGDRRIRRHFRFCDLLV